MEEKTNVMRLLEQKKIKFQSHHLDITEALSGVEMADMLGQNPAQVFKTLVTVGKTKTNYVIYPERDMATRLAVSISNDSIFDYIKLSDEYSIMEVTPYKAWIGKNVIQANVRAKYHINVLAVKNPQGDISMPGVEYIFNEKDHLIVMGQQDDLNKLF